MNLLASYADLIRWLNAGLAVLVVVLLLMGTMARWDAMPKRFKRAMPWVIGTYVVIAYGSGEIAASNDPVDPGIRVLMMLLILLGLSGTLVFGLTNEDYDR